MNENMNRRDFLGTVSIICMAGSLPKGDESPVPEAEVVPGTYDAAGIVDGNLVFFQGVPIVWSATHLGPGESQ